MVKGFGAAVMVKDSRGLERRAEGGRALVESLNSLAALSGLSAERSEEARKLASWVEEFLNDAKSLYGTVLSNPAAMTPEMQGRMKDLAARTDTIKASLQGAKDRFSKDLHEQLSALEARSAKQRWIALVVFGITLGLAGGIVNMTRRRA